MSDPRDRTRAEIDAETEQLKEWMRAQRETTDGHTWKVEQSGLMIRNGKITYADRQVGYDPVAHHPVWGDEVRQAYWRERQAGIETGPPLPVEVDERWRTMERWADEHCAARQQAGEIPNSSKQPSHPEEVLRQRFQVALEGHVQMRGRQYDSQSRASAPPPPPLAQDITREREYGYGLGR